MSKVAAPSSCDGTDPGVTRGDPEETTVLVVDDHRCFADLLSTALGSVEGIRCVGTAASAEEGIALASRLSPSVVVMDIQMPGTDGLAATRRLRATSPRTAVAVVTAHQDGEWISRAAQAGASAFIPKDGSLAEMIAMLTAAVPGPMKVAPSVLGVGGGNRPRGAAPRPDRTGEGPRDVPPHDLTDRELEVLGCIAQGLPAKSIAKVLSISVHTCRGYIKSVYAKLGVSSRIEAMNRARQLRLLDR